MGTSANKSTIKKSKAMSLEKENLEAHVDLCAERYQRLEEKYEELKKALDKNTVVIHERIDRVKDSIDEVRDLSIEQHFKQNRIIITAALGIIVAIVGAVASNLM